MSKADKTPNATFVSEDEKVSFDEAGYRLDSLGHRTYNNAGIGGEAKPRYTKQIQEDMAKWRAEVEQYERDMQAFLAAQSAGIARSAGAAGRPPVRQADSYIDTLQRLRSIGSTGTSSSAWGTGYQRPPTPTVDYIKQSLASSSVKLPGMDDQQPGIAPQPATSTWR